MKRWSSLVAVSVAAVGLLAPKAVLAQTYKFKVVTTSKEYGGHQFQIGDLNNKDQFSFNIVGPDKDNGGGGEVTYFWDGSTITRIQPSDTKLSDGAALISSNMWTPQSVNDLGHVAYVADTDKSPHAIVVWDSAAKTYTMISNIDTVVEGGKLTSAGVSLEGRMLADINNKDQVVWSEGLDPGTGDANDAVFFFDPATKKITTVARKGTALPGGKTILSALFPDIDDAGEIVFMANTADNENFGVYQWAGGNITVIAAPGTTVDGVKVESFKLPRISRTGGGFIVFRGELKASGSGTPQADDTGFFLSSGGKVTKIVAPGDALPAGKFVATEGNRRAIGVNKNGLVAFKATLENDRSGIFLWQAGKFTPLVTSGQTVESSKIDSVVQGLGGQDGYHMAINDFGDVVFSGVSGDVHEAILALAPR
jgi:hypothetical protein